MSRRSNLNRALAQDWAGFTLVEILVALAIVAVSLAAGLRSANTLIQNSERQSDAMLAQICAENALARLRLSGNLPGVGDSESECQQAGRAYGVLVSVRPTPNPGFRRVDARVSREAVYLLQFSTIVGRH